MCVHRKALLQTKEKPATQQNLSFVVTLYKMLPNIENFIDEHRHMLSFHNKLKALSIKNCSLSIEEIRPNNRR